VFILKHPLIRVLLLSGLLLNAVQYPLLTMLLPLYFEQVLAAGPRTYGLFLSMESVGLILLLLIAPFLAMRVGEGRLAGIALAAWGVGLGLLASISAVWHALLLGVVMGFLGAGTLPLDSVVESQTPDALRGRVGATSLAVIMAIVPPAYLLGGFLIDTVGPRPLYAVAGVLVAVCGVALLASRQVREARLVSQGMPAERN
jgi:MFS family permease